MTAAELRRRRLALSLTQVELATSLGLTERTIRDYETDAAAIPMTVALAVEFYCYTGCRGPAQCNIETIRLQVQADEKARVRWERVKRREARS